MLLAQSATKDYISDEHKPHSFSKLFMSQVIIPQVCNVRRRRKNPQQRFSVSGVILLFLLLIGFAGTLVKSYTTGEFVVSNFFLYFTAVRVSM